MKFMTIALLSTALFVLGAEPAEARRGGSSSQQELHFVADTKIPNGDGGTLSLCHLSTKGHILGVGLWRLSDGYALSAQKCEGERYIAFTEDRFQQARTLGLIAPDIPDEPVMTISMIASGFPGVAILVLIIAFSIYKQENAHG